MTYKMAPSSRTMEQNISTDSKAKLNGNIRSSLTDREIRRDYDEDEVNFVDSSNL